jgi:hypothetical protein
MNFTTWENILLYAWGLQQQDRRIFLSICAMLCWEVWKERNYRNLDTRAMVLFRIILSFFQFYIDISSGMEHLYRERGCGDDFR